jgi:hypothetical protein
MLDDRDAFARADKPSAAVTVHHGLVRLEDAWEAETQLQEFGAGDCVQAKRVHPGKVRQDSRSSFSARATASWLGQGGFMGPRRLSAIATALRNQRGLRSRKLERDVNGPV